MSSSKRAPSQPHVVSPLKTHNRTQRSSSKRMSPLKSQNQKLISHNYFCHYTNAVYMGGIDCFKKSGKGIVFMDNGACLVTCYNHDLMTGHNIGFKDRSMTSMIIGLNKAKSVCFRTGAYLLKIQYNNKDMKQGIGYFVHFKNEKLYKLKFQNGELQVKQRIYHGQIVDKIFRNQDFSGILQQQHIDALNMKINLPQNMKCLNSGEAYLIGFFDQKNKKKYVPNGLCFKIIIKNNPTDFDVILQERGFIDGQVMNYFGEKNFQNGNYYVGEFKQGLMDGRGLLIFPKQQNWTYSLHKSGVLVQVFDSSVKSNQTCQSILSKIHQQSKPFVKSKINISPSQSSLLNFLKTVDEKDPYEEESLKYTQQEQAKSKNLSVVQESYIGKNYSQKTQKALSSLLGIDEKTSEFQQKSSQSRKSPQKLSERQLYSRQATSQTKNPQYFDPKQPPQMPNPYSSNNPRSQFPSPKQKYQKIPNISPSPEARLSYYPRAQASASMTPISQFNIHESFNQINQAYYQQALYLRQLQMDLERANLRNNLNPTILQKMPNRPYRYLDKDYQQLISQKLMSPVRQFYF